MQQRKENQICVGKKKFSNIDILVKSIEFVTELQ